MTLNQRGTVSFLPIKFDRSEHSLLRAATDTELEIRNHVIRARKQRDMEMGRPIAFELIPVQLGENRYGKIISTCVMQEIDLTAEDDFDDLDDLTDREQIAMKVFTECENEKHELKVSDFRDKLEATKGFFEGDSRNSFYKAFSRTVDKLVDKSFFKIIKRKQVLKRLINASGQ